MNIQDHEERNRRCDARPFPENQCNARGYFSEETGLIIRSSLDLQDVAAGVELDDQLRRLRDLGCESAISPKALRPRPRRSRTRCPGAEGAPRPQALAAEGGLLLAQLTIAAEPTTTSPSSSTRIGTPR